jgi:hypothetical protein
MIPLLYMHRLIKLHVFWYLPFFCFGILLFIYLHFEDCIKILLPFFCVLIDLMCSSNVDTKSTHNVMFNYFIFSCYMTSIDVSVSNLIRIYYVSAHHKIQSSLLLCMFPKDTNGQWGWVL